MTVTRDVILLVRARDEASRVMADLGRHITSLGDQGQNAALKMNLIGVAAGTAAAAAAAGLIHATVQAAEFDAAMRKVNTIAGMSETQFKSMGDAVLRLATVIPVSAKDLATGLYYIESAGFKANDALSVLRTSATLSAAGFGDMETVSRGVITALRAFGLGAKYASQVGDALFQTVKAGIPQLDDFIKSAGQFLPTLGALSAGLPAPQKIKLFVDALSGFAAATRSGLTAERAATGLGRLGLDFVKLTPTLTTVIHSLEGANTSGQSFIQSMGGITHSVLVLNAVAAGSPTLLTKLFPDKRALNVVFSLVKDGGQATADVIKIMNQFQGASSRALVEASKSTTFQISLLKTGFNAAEIAIGQTFLPTIHRLAQDFQAFGRFITGLSEPMKRFLGQFVLGQVLVLGLAGAILSVAGIVKGFIAINKLAALELDRYNGSVDRQQITTARSAAETVKATAVTRGYVAATETVATAVRAQNVAIDETVISVAALNAALVERSAAMETLMGSLAVPTMTLDLSPAALAGYQAEMNKVALASEKITGSFLEQIAAGDQELGIFIAENGWLIKNLGIQEALVAAVRSGEEARVAELAIMTKETLQMEQMAAAGKILTATIGGNYLRNKANILPAGERFAQTGTVGAGLLGTPAATRLTDTEALLPLGVGASALQSGRNLQRSVERQLQQESAAAENVLVRGFKGYRAASQAAAAAGERIFGFYGFGGGLKNGLIQTGREIGPAISAVGGKIKGFFGNLSIGKVIGGLIAFDIGNTAAQFISAKLGPTLASSILSSTARFAGIGAGIGTLFGGPVGAAIGGGLGAGVGALIGWLHKGTGEASAFSQALTQISNTSGLTRDEIVKLAQVFNVDLNTATQDQITALSASGQQVQQLAAQYNESIPQAVAQLQSISDQSGKTQQDFLNAETGMANAATTTTAILDAQNTAIKGLNDQAYKFTQLFPTISGSTFKDQVKNLGGTKTLKTFLDQQLVYMRKWSSDAVSVINDVTTTFGAQAPSILTLFQQQGLFDPKNLAALDLFKGKLHGKLKGIVQEFIDAAKQAGAIQQFFQFGIQGLLSLPAGPSARTAIGLGLQQAIGEGLKPEVLANIITEIRSFSHVPIQTLAQGIIDSLPALQAAGINIQDVLKSITDPKFRRQLAAQLGLLGQDLKDATAAALGSVGDYIAQHQNLFGGKALSAIADVFRGLGKTLPTHFLGDLDFSRMSEILSTLITTATSNALTDSEKKLKATAQGGLIDIITNTLARGIGSGNKKQLTIDLQAAFKSGNFAAVEAELQHLVSPKRYVLIKTLLDAISTGNLDNFLNGLTKPRTVTVQAAVEELSKQRTAATLNNLANAKLVAPVHTDVDTISAEKSAARLRQLAAGPYTAHIKVVVDFTASIQAHINALAQNIGDQASINIEKGLTHLQNLNNSSPNGLSAHQLHVQHLAGASTTSTSSYQSPSDNTSVNNFSQGSTGTSGGGGGGGGGAGKTAAKHQNEIFTALKQGADSLLAAVKSLTDAIRSAGFQFLSSHLFPTTPFGHPAPDAKATKTDVLIQARQNYNKIKDFLGTVDRLSKQLPQDIFRWLAENGLLTPDNLENLKLLLGFTAAERKQFVSVTRSTLADINKAAGIVGQRALFPGATIHESIGTQQFNVRIDAKGGVIFSGHDKDMKALAKRLALYMKAELDKLRRNSGSNVYS